MDNEIKKGDTIFTTANFVNDITMLKTYTCIKTKHDAEGVMPMKIYFTNDLGQQDWHYNNMFTKTKEATPQEEGIMDNEIKKGDTFFIGMETSTINLTPLKSYVCTDVENNEDGLSYAIHFIDDNGEKDWHLSSMFTKTKEATPMMEVKPHKWADVIHQWADGAEIQSLVNGVNSSVWVTITDPLFTQNGQYRIKPSEEEELKEKIDNQHQRMTKAFKHYQDVCDESFKEIKKLKGNV